MEKIKNFLNQPLSSVYEEKKQLFQAKKLLQQQFPELKQASFKAKGVEKLYIQLSGLLSYEGAKKKKLYSDFLLHKSEIKYTEILMVFI